jgi:hypothetical protein
MGAILLGRIRPHNAGQALAGHAQICQDRYDPLITQHPIANFTGLPLKRTLTAREK